jgi:hypothetical protein
LSFNPFLSASALSASAPASFSRRGFLGLAAQIGCSCCLTSLAGCVSSAPAGKTQYGPSVLVLSAVRRDFLGHIKETGPQSFLGIDYSVGWGTPVVATDDGIVLLVETTRSIGGLTVWVDHGDGYISVSQHLGRAHVKFGDTVRRGQHIADSGNSGSARSGSPMVSHLHYGFGHLFTGRIGARDGESLPLWIDPDTMGEDGGALRLYAGQALPETARKLYQRDMIATAARSVRNESVLPAELRNVLNGLSPIYGHGRNEWMIRQLVDHSQAFADGTSAQYERSYRQLVAGHQAPPFVLTHPIKA